MLVGPEVCMLFIRFTGLLKGESGTLVLSCIRTLSGVPVPVVILGDPAYPLLQRLLMPYLEVGVH